MTDKGTRKRQKQNICAGIKILLSWIGTNNMLVEIPALDTSLKAENQHARMFTYYF